MTDKIERCVEEKGFRFLDGATPRESPDGQRFLMLKIEDEPNSAARIVMVQDWTTELKRLMPTK